MASSLTGIGLGLKVGMKLEISSMSLSFLARYLLDIEDRTGHAFQSGLFQLPGISEFSFTHGGRFMKIQNKYKMIISLCLLIATAFFLDSHLREKSQPVVYKRPVSVSKGLNVNSMTLDDVSELYCGILLMPKSMVPRLEQISRYRFSEDIKILPAKIEWDNGCMVAIAEENPTLQHEANPDHADGKDVQVKDAELEDFAAKDMKKFNAALLYYFLANASKSQINY